jgi:hypothetical protein
LTFCNRDIFADERLCGLDVQLSPRLQGVAATALLLADPVLSKIISPALSEFLNTGWPVTVIPEVPAGTIGISSRAWAMPGSLRGFRIWVRQIQHLVATVSIATTSVRPHVQAIAVGLELTSITLPESIQSLLADELAKANRGAHARTPEAHQRAPCGPKGKVVTARQAKPGQSTVRARTELACRIDRVNLVLFGPVAIPDGPSLSVRGLWGRGDSGKNCLPPLLSFASWNR